jgi:hypothetical protein
VGLGAGMRGEGGRPFGAAVEQQEWAGGGGGGGRRARATVNERSAGSGGATLQACAWAFEQSG